MTPRERILALLVGACILVGLFVFGARRVAGSFSDRQTQIAQLQNAIREKERIVERGQEAGQRMIAYENRSLPAREELASSHYRAWLMELISESNLSEATVKLITAKPHRGIFTELKFSITATGDLSQLTQLLHNFYSADHLHRIAYMNLQPAADARMLDLNLTIDALALTSAPPEQKLTAEPSDRLQFGELNEYLETIVGRNIFAPANEAPQIALPKLPPIYQGQPATIQIVASDPDANQQLRYSLDKAENVPGLNINAETGQLQITAKEAGPLAFAVRVTDNGVPPQSAVAQLQLVVQQAVSAAEEQFDTAKFTYVTGITAEEGKPQLWLHVRPEGKMLKLSEGDQFEVGDVKGVVHRIGSRDVELELDGKRTIVSLGQNLREAREMPQA